MEALRDHPERRAEILVTTTGTRRRIALKRSPASCARDVEIALQVAETDAETVVTMFDPDDRARHLEPDALWLYITEPASWLTNVAKAAELDAARADMTYLFERALENGIVSPRDIVEGVTVEELTKRLPTSEIATVLSALLDAGHRDKPFTEADLLEQIHSAGIVKHVPLPRLFEGVVEAKIAPRLGLTNVAFLSEPETALRPPGTFADGALTEPAPPQRDAATVPGSALARVSLQQQSAPQTIGAIEEVRTDRRDPREPTDRPPESS